MEQLAQDIYDTLTGTLLPEYRVPGVENAFEEGSFCAEKYSEMLNAYWRLCERLGVEEDPDGETMINSLLQIQKILCLKMFEYGCQYGRKA